ncbi:MAG: UDP-glucose--hexose-1-phosphate uridylyltransferase [Candidatus Dadabacteria bacterium]
MFDFKEQPHRRLNILTGEWILVSPHRTKRPWQGKVESLSSDMRPSYDPGCYLCPGNKRADGSVNPEYTNSFVFTNDYAALMPGTEFGSIDVEGLLHAESESGICKVISFSPDHSLTLPLLTVEAIKKIIEVWQQEFQNLSENHEIRYIQIFENKGEVMGCSNPHPHGQIWASSSVPVEVEKETIQQKNYYNEKGRSLLKDYIELEHRKQERIVLENDFFVVLVPFWAVWPFETMIVSKRQIQNILQFSEEEKNALASILKKLTAKYDNMFQISFPYSAGIHQAPVNEEKHLEWHWHMHFYPPLLRSATVKKFMVGYEMLANPQRDVTPEWAAEQIRGLSDVHYKESGFTAA